MLDFDLAELYGAGTKALNQAVKRNIERFPEDFMFRLTEDEWMRSQIVTSSEEKGERNWSQIVTSSDDKSEMIDNQLDGVLSPSVMRSEDRISQKAYRRKQRGKTYLPYAFTEHGVSMLASVLRSQKAVQMSIAIVRAFIALKQYVMKREVLSQHLRQIVERLDAHDVQLNSIYDAIENLLDEKADEKEEALRWAERERIGFKK
jgi:hypothetical protein